MLFDDFTNRDLGINNEYLLISKSMKVVTFEMLLRGMIVKDASHDVINIVGSLDQREVVSSAVSQRKPYNIYNQGYFTCMCIYIDVYIYIYTCM